MKNKILYVFFAVTALLCCFVFSASAGFELSADDVLQLEEIDNYFECYAAGDVDENGEISADDARTILRVSVNLDKIDTSKFMKADVDGDGSITAADARLALRLAVGLDKAPEHDVHEIVVVPATCSTEGLTVKICTSCMQIYAKVTLPASTDKHITSGWSTVKEPTCIDKGLAQLKCIACNEIVREEEISATSKHAGEWNYPDGKDCYNPVKKNRTCTVCGTFEERVENPQGGHSYAWETVTENTCTENGTQVYKCTNCGLIKEEAAVPAIGHIFEYDKTIKEPTCTETGLKAKKCINCDAQEKEYATEALGHSFNNKHYTVTKEATCAEEGSADVVCSRCGEADTITLDKLPHTINGEWTTVTEPDCVNEGLKKGECTACGEVEEAIPAKGHTVKRWTKVKAATCTEEGLMTGECSVCGDKSATKPIEKTAHDFNDKVQYWTGGVLCKENGTGYYKCRNCDAKQQIILLQRPCNNDNFKKTRTVTQATCTTKETVIDVCDFCKEDIEGTITSTGSALGHEFDRTNGLTTSRATCTTDGEIKYKCVRCEETTTEVIAALGHINLDEDWQETPASCTEAGSRECACARCGEITTEEIPVAPHTPTGEWVTEKAASCAEAGIEIIPCDVCGEATQTREIPKSEHTPVNGVIADSASIDENGNYVVRCVTSCDVCGELLSEESTITRIAVMCNSDDIKVVFSEGTDLTPGSTVSFSLEGDTENIVVQLAYGVHGDEVIEESYGLYSFTLPEDLGEAEKVTIAIFKLN